MSLYRTFSGSYVTVQDIFGELCHCTGCCNVTLPVTMLMNISRNGNM